MALDEVKPWGRSFAEYRAMFALADEDMGKRIIDCAGGPASFNAELTELGGSVVSCDPLYEYSAEAIEARIREATPEIVEHVNADRERYVWTAFDSPEQMIEVRLATMRRFIADFPLGLTQGRYLPASLPQLPLDDGAFELALCSHFLFTYSEQLSLDFHLDAAREMARVAAEVRIFPLLDHSGNQSAYLEPVCEELTAEGYSLRREKVAYEFQRGGDQMLVLRGPEA